MKKIIAFLITALIMTSLSYAGFNTLTASCSGPTCIDSDDELKDITSGTNFTISADSYSSGPRSMASATTVLYKQTMVEVGRAESSSSYGAGTQNDSDFYSGSSVHKSYHEVYASTDMTGNYASAQSTVQW